MTAYYKFLRAYPAHVGFGFVLTFFSSLGQTFLISLYVPHILADLGLTNSAFGTMYAIATIGSALLLMNFGDRIDRKPLPAYSYRAIGILSGATIILGLTHHAILLPIALLGIRFAGQGLMTHISQTVLGRYFVDDRGKALSLASLGFSVGEMVFPVVIALLIPLVGWRISLAINAGVLLAVLVPTLRYFPMKEFERSRMDADTDGVGGRSLTPLQLMKTPAFRIVAPSVVFLSFANTGVFFYQLVLAESRGWSVAWYSLMFSGYAAARFLFGLFGGLLVDRFTARRLYVIHLLPLMAGLVILALTPAKWGALAFLFSAGLSLGMNSPIKAAMFAELHGTDGLGAVRSTYTAFMVGGTALGPMVFGGLLDMGVGFGPILLGTALILGLSTAPAVRLANMDPADAPADGLKKRKDRVPVTV